MENEYPRIGTGMIIYNSHNQILMGKRLSPYGYGTWNNAGGKLEFGEDPLLGAQREAREETNLGVYNINHHGYFNDKEIYEEGKSRHWVTMMFSGQAIIPAKLENLEPTKHSQWNWFTVDEWPKDMWIPMERWWHSREGLRLKKIIKDRQDRTFCNKVIYYVTKNKKSY